MFACLILYSCAKEGKNIYVEGRVYNGVNNQGISNFEMKLSKSKDGFETKIVDQTFSDNQGNFVLKHNGVIGGDYFACPISIPQGYTIVRVYSPDNNEEDLVCEKVEMFDPKTVYVELIKSKLLTLELNNINCINQNDSIYVSISHQYFGPDFFTFYEVGCIQNELENLWTTIGYNVIKWTVVKNGITNVFLDSVYINSSDSQVIFTINY